jgi:hypothetical protein
LDEEKKRTSQTTEHATSLAAGERERVQTLEQDARTVPHLQRQVQEQQRANRALQIKLEIMQAERAAFVNGSMLERRRLTKQWETEARRS